MHQITKDISKNILTKCFFKKKYISLLFRYENGTLSTDYFVKLIRSYLSTIKYFFLNLRIASSVTQICGISKDFTDLTLYLENIFWLFMNPIPSIKIIIWMDIFGNNCCFSLKSVADRLLWVL